MLRKLYNAYKESVKMQMKLNDTVHFRFFN